MSREQSDSLMEHDDKRTIELLNHLSNKYNESFEVIGKIGQARGIPGDLWGVRRIKNSERLALAADAEIGNEAFTVTGNITANGYIIKDSYYKIHILPEYRKFVNEIVKKHLNEFKLRVDILNHKSYADSLTKDVLVQDISYMINNNELFKAEITVSFHEAELGDRSFNDICADICNELAGARLNVWLTCYMESKSENTLSTTYYVDEFYHASQKNKGFRKQGIPDMPDKEETMSINKLTPWQAERLCCLIYLDSLLYHIDKGCLYDILSYMLVFGYDDSKICERLPNDLTKEEWDAVIMQTLKDPYLARLKIADYVDINEKTIPENEVLYGHKVICFIDEDKNAIVIFRGTYGDDEWLDNAKGMLISDTKQQIAAAKYIIHLRENKELGIKKIVTAGHSKGGNKAQYVMITLPDGYVDRCISINGQGFSDEFIKKYNEQINKRRDNIELLAERRDIVNCLGIGITKTYYYEGRRGEHTDRYPYGQPIAYYHYPDALRMNDGREGNMVDFSIIAEIVNTFIISFFSNDKYRDIKEETSVNIISLMMTKKTMSYAEIAESIKNLILLFIELSVDNVNFDKLLLMLIIKEADVLLATIGTIYSSKALSENNLNEYFAEMPYKQAFQQNKNGSYFRTEPNDNPDDETAEILSRLIRNKLAFSIITNSKNYEYFQKFISKAIKLIKNITHEIKYSLDLVNYLYMFFDSMFSYMKENSSFAGKILASKMEERFVKIRLNIYEKTHEELFEIGIDQSFSRETNEFSGEDLIRYIYFSINVYKENSPLLKDLINRKIFIVNKAIQLIDTVFSNAKDSYIVNRGEPKSIKEYWKLINQCLIVDLYLCGFLEEEDIYTDGSYVKNDEFKLAYTDVLKRVIFHIENISNKGLFINDVQYYNADISDIINVGNEIDNYIKKYSTMKLHYQALLNELREYDSIKGIKEYWMNHQSLLNEEIHKKTLGLHLLKVNKDEIVDYEKRLKKQYDKYVKYSSSLTIAIGKKTTKRRMIEEAKKQYAKICICELQVLKLDLDIEKLHEVIEELNGYKDLLRNNLYI